MADFRDPKGIPGLLSGDTSSHIADAQQQVKSLLGVDVDLSKGLLGFVEQGKNIEKASVALLQEVRTLRQAQESGLRIDGLNERLIDMQNKFDAVTNLISNLAANLYSGSGSNDDLRFLKLASRYRGESHTRPATRLSDSEVQSLFERQREAAGLEERQARRDELHAIRTDTRMARGMAYHGRLTPELREDLERQRDMLEGRLEGLEEQYAKAKASGDSFQASHIATEYAATSNLSREITNVLEYGASKQESKLNKALNTISSVISALGVASFANRIFLQDPYQFQTRPALETLGNQGEIGNLLSNAYGELEAHRLSLNQTGLFTGAGMLGAGIGLMRGGGTAGMIGGGLLAAGGAIAGGLGLTSRFDELYMNYLPGTLDEDDILGQSIVKQLMDPGRLIGHFTTSRAGLFAAGANGRTGFGFSGNTQTGNTILDRMASLTGLGFSAEQMGALLSQTALGLRGGSEDMTRLATSAGTIGTVFGISPESVLANMQMAQRFGSQDAEGSLLAAIGAAADSEGNITSYTTNVLVPALLKVTESLSIQNLARSGDELLGEVSSLRSTIVNTDSTLGRMVEQNPEALNRVINTLQEASGASLNNPAMMAFNLAQGSSFEDMVMKRPEVIERNLQAVLRSPLAKGMDFNNVFDSGVGIGLMNYASALTGINDFQMLQQLLITMQSSGGRLLGGDGGLTPEAQQVLDNQKAAEQEIQDRVDAILGEELGTLASDMATQSNELIKAQQGLTQAMIDFQAKIGAFVTDDRILELAAKGMNNIIGKANEFLDLPANSGLIDYSFDSDGNFRLSPRGASGGGGGGGGGGGSSGRAIGGYTGMGGTHQIAGSVHAGEYVISSHRVKQNRELLDRIQSGEDVSGRSIRKEGNVTYVTLRIHGASAEDIYRTAQEATEDYIYNNRLNYT